MSIAAAILAAGSSERFGKDKTQLILGDKPVWRHSFDVLSSHPGIDEVFVVCSAGNEAAIREHLPAGVHLIRGGDTRQGSSIKAVRFGQSLGCSALLLHDAARPFLSSEVIGRVLDGISAGRSCAPALPVTDTIKEVVDDSLILRTHQRAKLRAMQTPQGVLVEDFLSAVLEAPADFTDDLSVLESAGYPTHVVTGDPLNFKLTTQEDFDRALALRSPMETRTGLGYDIHRFSTEPDRPLFLGGVLFEGEVGLEGHSDADVVLHAVTDALLGAAALGDIGVHFKNTDPRWKNQASILFVTEAARMLAEAGWSVVHVDIAVQAERPKVMPRAEEIRRTIAVALGLTVNRVSLKATTNEGLGAIGRAEGICAFATATVRR